MKFVYLTTKPSQFAARISLDEKLKDHSGALHSPFFASLQDTSITELKTYGFYATLAPLKELVVLYMNVPARASAWVFIRDIRTYAVSIYLYLLKALVLGNM